MDMWNPFIKAVKKKCLGPGSYSIFSTWLPAFLEIVTIVHPFSRLKLDQYRPPFPVLTANEIERSAPVASCFLDTLGVIYRYVSPLSHRIPPLLRRMLLFQRAFTEGAHSLLMQCCQYADLETVLEGGEKERVSLLLDLLTLVAKSYPSEISILSTRRFG